MPTYSNWVTHEYEVTAGATGTPTGTKGTVERGPWLDPFYDQGELEAALTAAVGAQSAASSPSLSYGIHLDRRLRTTTPLVYDRYYVGGVGTITERVAAGSLSDNSFDPTLPPGATGWEWEPIAPEITGASASLTFGATIEDGTASPPQPAAGGEAYVQVRTAGTLLAEDSIYRPPGNVVVAVDVTPHVNAASNGEVFFERTIRHVSAPVPADPLADASIYLNGGVGVLVTYSVSRRYRFVYPGEQPPPVPQRQPHLRVVQRGNDGLGITGGRRIIGTKTIQSSNRRGTAIR